MLEEVRKHIEELIAKETGDTLRRQVLELESTIDTLKLTEAFTAGGDNRAAKEKLDQLIREVDKCISWLEN